MSPVSKATRATIKLGDIELDVFQLPDGSYRFSQTDAFISIANNTYDTKQAAKRYIEISRSKTAKTLLNNASITSKVLKVEGENQNQKTISSTDIIFFWLVASELGYPKATKLIAACAIESLERRADKAFDVVRSEDEYNQRLEQRLRGKATRRTLTDAIKSYIETNNLQDSNYAKFIYSNVSDRLNLGIFNRRSHRLKADWELKPTENIRDHLNKDELRWLEQCEDLAMRLIDFDDLEPLRAMDEAIARLIIPPVNR